MPQGKKKAGGGKKKGSNEQRSPASSAAVSPAMGPASAPKPVLTSPVLAATNDPVVSTEIDGIAKTKTKAAAPIPPPALATGALLIRGAAARVLGLRPAAAGGDIQPVWVTEAGCSKVTISLEKSSKIPFWKEDAHGALIDAIEREVQRIIAVDAEISIIEIDKNTAETKYGEAMYEPKSSKAEVLKLAYIPDVLLVEVPKDWILCSRCSSCSSLRFLQKEAAKKGKNPDTHILSKKRQLSVKYQVDMNTSNEEAVAGKHPDPVVVRGLDDGSVKVDVTIKEHAAAPSAEIVEENFVCLLCKGTGLLCDGMDDVCPVCDGKSSGATAQAEVTPWTVTDGEVDYEKLSRDFGSTLISETLLERMTRCTVGAGRVANLHSWIRRGIFYSHRDMDLILNCFEKNVPFYLYTGRGPSSASMHLGHLVPFMMTKWLQDAFDVPLVIQMTDDEKFLWKGKYDPDKGDDLMRYHGLTIENAKDIIAVGFDKKKTFIFSDLEYVGHMYPNIVRTWKAITYNTARGAFGFAGDSNIGQSAFPAIQAVPSFPSSFKIPLKGQDKMACLIPCAIDQDPYFRVTRDIAHKLVPTDHPLKGKPALFHSKFFPPLQGAKGKMSASDPNSAIYLTDTPEEIEKKIETHAFSGGRATLKEQKAKGADLNVDVSYQWLRFFLEDDNEIAKIGKEYGSGQGEDYWSTGQVKKRLITELQAIVAKHQERRAMITDEEVMEWMRVRELDF